MSTDRSRTRSSRSRPPSRHSTHASVPYVPQAESLILPDGSIGEEAAELLTEFVHGRSEEPTYFNLEDDNASEPASDGHSADAEERDRRRKLPWWKRPSPLWLLVLIPFTSIAMTSTAAPKIELFTQLACEALKPEYTSNRDHQYMSALLRISNNSASPAHDYDLAMSPLDRALDHIYLPDTHRAASTDTVAMDQKQCASDPVVQAAVAKLSASMSTTMGILGASTTAAWGAFSDRYGRTRVLGISIVGLLLTDANFIIVAKFSKYLPGGYWFLLLGPVIEGCLGGMTSAVAAGHAYMADTTDSGSRSRTFSLSLGLIFSGVALGPTFGGLLIRFTHQTLSVFYFATTIHFIYALLVWFAIPESLLKTQMQRSKLLRAEETMNLARDREANPAAGIITRVQRAFKFLSPLHIFIPTVIDTGSPLKPKRRDWNLTLVALSYGFTIAIMGAYTSKFQYAAAEFGWSSETLGYFLTLVGAARAGYLALILPVAIKFFKPRPISLVSDSSKLDALLPPDTSDSSPLQSPPVAPPLKPEGQHEPHAAAFDLALARISLGIEILAYGILAVSTSPMSFAVLGVIGSFGSGFSPAIQSVALEMYTKRGGTESGRLFGALSVVQALCSQVFGPTLFALTYMKTVAFFPRAIFFVSVLLVIISLALLSLVRLPKSGDTGDIDAEDQLATGINRDTTLVDIESNSDESERGRKGKNIPSITVTSV